MSRIWTPQRGIQPAAAGDLESVLRERGWGDLADELGVRPSELRAAYTGRGAASGGVTAISDVGLATRGLIAESYPPTDMDSLTAGITSQFLIGALVPLRAGQVVSKIWVFVGAPLPAGASPTLTKVGLMRASDGLVLGASADIGAALVAGPLGYMGFSLTAPFTVLVTGGYYACFLVNGAWGTTQLSLARSGALVGAGGQVATQKLGGTAPTLGIGVAGQTDIAGTIAPVGNTPLYWFGAS